MGDTGRGKKVNRWGYRRLNQCMGVVSDRKTRENDIDESSDSLRTPWEYYPRIAAPPRFRLFPSPRYSSVRILLRLRQTSFKKNRVTEKLSLRLSALRNRRVFNCSKLFKRWLAQQLKVFVGGACLQNKRFFWALFSRNIFAWTRYFKELQLKGNLIDCP